jgi:hypothetical protein
MKISFVAIKFRRQRRRKEEEEDLDIGKNKFAL